MPGSVAIEATMAHGRIEKEKKQSKREATAQAGTISSTCEQLLTGRINSNDTKVQNRHQCQCRFDEAENVDLEVAALV